MALINKTGITNGGTIEAEHITRAIDALSGGSTDSVSITGSLMGSSSYAVTASYAMNGGGGASESASYASTSSTTDTIRLTDTATGIGPWYPVFASAAGLGQIARIDTSTFTYNATTNNLTVTSSFALTSSVAMSASITRKISLTAPPIQTIGDMWFQSVGPNPGDGRLYIVTVDGAWVFNSDDLL
jgi:hypothetical protein